MVGAVAAPYYFFVLPSHPPRPGTKIPQRLREVDWLGALLLIGTFICGLMAISFGGALYNWNSSQIIGLFVGFGVLLILFSVQQALCILTTKDLRLFPVECLKRYEMLVFFYEVAAAIGVLFIAIYFIPLYFQFVRGDNALEAGVRLLPLIFIAVFFNAINGIVMGKTGYYAPWYWVGAAFCIAGTAVMRTVDVETSTSKVYGYSILIAVGTGAFTQASFPVVQAKYDPSFIPKATAFIGCGQLLGLSLSFSIGNSIFINQAVKRITDIIPDAPIGEVQLAISGAGGALLTSVAPEQQRQILTAITDSISEVYDLVLAASALAFLLSLSLKVEKLFIQT